MNAQQINALKNIDNLLDQVNEEVRKLGLHSKLTKDIDGSIFDLYAECEGGLTLQAKADKVVEWGFKAHRDEYRRNAPDGHYEIWRFCRPNNIIICKEGEGVVSTFDIDWKLHNI